MVCVDSLTIATESSTVASARIFYWGFNVFAYLLPLSLCIIFYLLLVKKIWKQKIVTSKTSQKMKRHATRMVFAVILTFGICWFPQNLRFFLRGYNYPGMSFWEHNTEILVLMQSMAQILAYSNSCINPILYGILSERFRTGLAIAVDKVLCLNEKDGGRHKRHAFTQSAFSRSVVPPHSSPSITKLCTPVEDLLPKHSSSKSNLIIPSVPEKATTVYMDFKTSDSEETQVML
uniref:G-protein coupled receptors family 1 profile domain-containing protein n=1 Tax=Panagrolaimus superbus TaxID=310955 RepID=A0A914XZ33_9BILA